MSDFDHPVFGRMPERIFADRDVETNEKRWYSTPGMGEPYVRVDTNYRKLAEVETLRAEITKLKSQLEEARAENKRLRDGVEIMANPEHWGAALNLSTSIGIKAWDFARALLNGSANKEGGKS